jgi:hypothetical protein
LFQDRLLPETLKDPIAEGQGGSDDQLGLELDTKAAELAKAVF